MTQTKNHVATIAVLYNDNSREVYMASKYTVNNSGIEIWTCKGSHIFEHYRNLKKVQISDYSKKGYDILYIDHKDRVVRQVGSSGESRFGIDDPLHVIVKTIISDIERDKKENLSLDVVSVKWCDGSLEKFEILDIRFGPSLVWVRLADRSTRYIPLDQVKWIDLSDRRL